MVSKLKILVDYPCEVFCDLEFKGQANPDSVFSLDLRRGTCYLEFKVDGVVQDKRDYYIDSEGEDYLLRISIASVVVFKNFHVSSKARIERSRENYHHCFMGKTFVKRLYDDEKHDIKWQQFAFSSLKSKPSSDFLIIFEDQAETYVEDSNEYETIECRFELLIKIDDGKSNQEVLIDSGLLVNYYNQWDGIVAVYVGNIVKLYYVEKSKVTKIKSINAEAGVLYSIDKSLALTIKKDRFGIYNIDKNITLCPNIYEELYVDLLNYHGDYLRYFISTDRYTVTLKGKRGIINCEGQELLPCVYDIANPCSLGYIVKKGDAWGLSKDGECPQEWYDDIFSTDLSGYGIVSGHVFSPTIETLLNDDFFAGCILYFKKKNKYGYWDVFGQQSKILYDKIETDHLFGRSLDRLIETCIGNRIGYIDCFGQEIIPCLFESIRFARCDEECLALYCDNKLFLNHGIITKNYSYYLKEPSNYNYYDFDFIAKFKGKYGVSTISGLILIPFEYDSIELLYADDFIVEKNSLFGIVRCDTEASFEFLLPIEYADVESLKKTYDQTYHTYY